MTAMCRAVALFVHTLGMFISAPFSSKSSTMFIFPLLTAICNAVFPVSNGSFKSNSGKIYEYKKIAAALMIKLGKYNVINETYNLS